MFDQSRALNFRRKENVHVFETSSVFVQPHFNVWTSRKSFAELLTTLTSLEATEGGAGGGGEHILGF
jgi:hypothetical protein